ncbi:uncharacterized protein BJ171DRAFT_111694 [Polychytrium aggregatum]|uniref:uncharacterized protein n=1 Tax=Polychytrium aggregatum TaxID=110093 RepID=UPI0022FF2ADD|nr:uncharacterized protein BJ171DRAFT_111694 [Polychytrium aggregatum]KAI9209243.1 hypothetical protein BJ171DRAFT_111694 [Polychytrium aggregatum]
MKTVAAVLCALSVASFANAACVGGSTQACNGYCYNICNWQGATSPPYVVANCNACISNNCGTCGGSPPPPATSAAPAPSPVSPPPAQCVGGSAQACNGYCYNICNWQGATSPPSVVANCNACISNNCNGCSGSPPPPATSAAPAPSPVSPPPAQCVGGSAQSCRGYCYNICNWQGAMSPPSVVANCNTCISNNCNGC